jgi:HPr kinase/phosphorylase
MQRPAPGASAETVLHASCVAHGGRAALITGRSGSGKSALALELMAHGARLVADDRTHLRATATALLADAPPAIRGLIEARGVGLLHAAPWGPAPVALVIDMDTAETERLPPRRSIELLGHRLALLHKVDKGYFPAAILQYLLSGRAA